MSFTLTEPSAEVTRRQLKQALVEAYREASPETSFEMAANLVNVVFRGNEQEDSIDMVLFLSHHGQEVAARWVRSACERHFH